MRITEVFQEQIQSLKKLGGTAAQTAKNMEFDLSVAKEVIIKPYDENSDVKNIVDAFLKAGKSIKIQKCFDNSALLAQFDDRIQYVEGHALEKSNILIDHAWNSYGNFHFDLTAELALKISFSGYLAAKVFDGIDL